MKKLVKLLTVAFVMLLILGINGCGAKEENSEKQTSTAMTIDELYKQGYSLNGSCLSDGQPWKGYYIKDGDWTHPYLVEIPMTQEEADEIYGAMSDEETQKIICAKKDSKITDLSDQVPAKEEIEKCVGKTLADLEADGYYVSSSTEGEDGNVIVECSKSGEYTISITLNEKMSFDEFNGENVDYSALTVKEAKFAGFSLD